MTLYSLRVTVTLKLCELMLLVIVKRTSNTFKDFINSQHNAIINEVKNLMLDKKLSQLI